MSVLKVMQVLQRNILAIILISVAGIFLAIGVWQEEFEVVFRKAVNICMECIGLG